MSRGPSGTVSNVLSIGTTGGPFNSLDGDSYPRFKNLRRTTLEVNGEVTVKKWRRGGDVRGTRLDYYKDLVHPRDNGNGTTVYNKEGERTRRV